MASGVSLGFGSRVRGWGTGQYVNGIIISNDLYFSLIGKGDRSLMAVSAMGC